MPEDDHAYLPLPADSRDFAPCPLSLSPSRRQVFRANSHKSSTASKVQKVVSIVPSPHKSRSKSLRQTRGTTRQNPGVARVAALASSVFERGNSAIHDILFEQCGQGKQVGYIQDSKPVTASTWGIETEDEVDIPPTEGGGGAARNNPRSGESVSVRSTVKKSVGFKSPEPTPSQVSEMSWGYLSGTFNKRSPETRVRTQSMGESLQKWPSQLRSGSEGGSVKVSGPREGKSAGHRHSIRTLEEERERRANLDLVAELNHMDIAFEETNSWRDSGSRGESPRLRIVPPKTPLTGLSRVSTMSQKIRSDRSQATADLSRYVLDESHDGGNRDFEKRFSEDLFDEEVRGVNKESEYDNYSFEDNSFVMQSSRKEKFQKEKASNDYDYEYEKREERSGIGLKERDAHESEREFRYRKAWLESQKQNDDLRHSVESLEAQCKMLAQQLGLEGQLKQQCGI